MRVNGQVIDQPASTHIDVGALVITVDNPPRYVSRGGFKLEAALDTFAVYPHGRVCADVGSSTGGFTDCLLQRGAQRVHALDVGANQLHWKLRNDPRVRVQERVNVRFVDALPEPVALVVIDVSFISLRLILPKTVAWLSPANLGIIALIKPQFEAGREQVGKGGIVRDPAVHLAVVERVTGFAATLGWPARAVIDSPILGTDGNKEFLAHFCRTTDV